MVFQMLHAFGIEILRMGMGLGTRLSQILQQHTESIISYMYNAYLSFQT